MTDPVEYLQRLRVGLVSSQLPEDVSIWLAAGIEQHMAGEPLEAALGLKSRRGKSSVPARLQLERRDEIIRRLARQLEGAPWTRAGLLADMVADYGRWKKARLALPPASIAGWRLRYFEAADSLELEIPASQSQISRILNGRHD